MKRISGGILYNIDRIEEVPVQAGSHKKKVIVTLINAGVVPVESKGQLSERCRQVLVSGTI